jgi:hypothetical protein
MAKGFLEGYETYDPEEEGYGSPYEWRECFFERMGLAKAQEVLGERDPLEIIGITVSNPTWEDISKAFRRLILNFHPDHNPGHEAALDLAKEILAAYVILEDRYAPSG